MAVVSRKGDMVAVWNDEAGAWDYQRADVAGPEEGMGSGEAFLAQAGGAFSSIPDRLQAGLYGAVGSGMEAMGMDVPSAVSVPAQAAQGRLAEVQQRMAPLEEQNPMASLGGQVIGSAPAGGPVTNAILGGLYGASAPADTPQERGMNMAMQAGLSIFGDKLGGMVSNMVRRGGQRMGGELSRYRQQSLDTLKEANVPLTKGQRTGNPRDIAQDNVRNVGAQQQRLFEEQSQALSRQAGDALDVTTDALTPDKLAEAAGTIGAKFERAAAVPRVATNMDELVRIAGRVDDETVTPGLVTRVLDQVPEEMTGRQYVALRGNLSKRSEQLYKQGHELEAALVDDVIEVLDDSLDAAAPELTPVLREARTQWRLLKTLEAGRAVSGTNQLNPATVQSALRRKFPSARRGNYPEGPVGDFIETIDAYNAVAPRHRTSGTAELLAPFLYGSQGGTIKKAARGAARLVDESLEPGSAIGGAAGRSQPD